MDCFVGHTTTVAEITYLRNTGSAGDALYSLRGPAESPFKGITVDANLRRVSGPLKKNDKKK